MRRVGRLRGVWAGAALIALVWGAPGAQAAGLFDAIGAIFGADPAPPRIVQPKQRGFYDEGEGLDVTVRPRRSRPHRERRVIRREKAPAAPIAANLDPAKNRNWYLEDPTLRRGDIVVLDGEVLVFEGSGRGPHVREDFTSLDRSRLPKAEREKVGAMAGLPRARAPLADMRNKTATVSDGD